jgi:hypothetical protein
VEESAALPQMTVVLTPSSSVLLSSFLLSSYLLSSHSTFTFHNPGLLKISLDKPTEMGGGNKATNPEQVHLPTQPKSSFSFFPPNLFIHLLSLSLPPYESLFFPKYLARQTKQSLAI